MIEDTTLQTLVMEELAWEPGLDAAQIGVAAKNGVVTLSGFVGSYAAKLAAERAAGRVRGVRAIAEEIEVRLPDDHKWADSEIAGRALNILAWDIEVPENRIKVKVSHGVVTLTGEVGYHFQKAAAEADVRRLGGVCGVVNLIHLAPHETTTADSEVVRQKIEDALRRNAEIDADRIVVGVDGGSVTLRGTVPTWAERQTARSAAWAAPGVSKVIDELEVRP